MEAPTCEHPAYAIVEGVLVCHNCGAPSPSEKWQGNVYGEKAVEQQNTENKGRFWPSESKRGKARMR